MATSGEHVLLVASSEAHRRAAVARWVADQLATGAKVLYAAPRPTSPRRHWLTGPPAGRAVHAALADGRLELVDLTAVLAATGATADGVLAAQHDAVLRALAQGWPRVAWSAEGTDGPVVVGGGGITAHERGLDALVGELPLRALCQLVPDRGGERAVWDTVAVHHGDLVDETWSARTVDGVWTPVGELGAPVARRFGAALHAALEDAERRGPPPAELHVDLAGVEFLDVACARLIVLAARSVGSGGRVMLHRPSRWVRRLVDDVEERGRPRTLVWADAPGR